jgi:hypothetical protein
VQGKILPTELEHWMTQLANNFDVKSAELANAKPALQTQFQRTFNNADRTATLESKERSAKLQRLVADQMRKEGVDYDTAWQDMKKAHPEIFNSMHQPDPTPTPLAGRAF